MPTTTTIEETVPAALAEQETHPAESPGTCQGLARWQSYPLATTDDKDPLALRSRELAANYNISVEAATAICCCAVSAAIGGAWRLRGPGQISTPASVNVTLVSPSRTPVQLAVEDAFRYLKMVVRGSALAHSRTDGAQLKAVEQAIVDKFTAAKKLEGKADRVDGDGSMAGMFARFRQVPEESLAKAKELRDEAHQEHHRLEARRRPLFLVQGVTPGQVMDTRRLSGDGSVFCLDQDSIFWTSLASERPQKAREYAGRIAAGWNAEPRIVGSEIHPASCLGSLSVMDHETFAGVWRSRALKGSYLRRMVFVGGDGTMVDAYETDVEPGGEVKFDQMLLGLTAPRNIGGDVAVKVGEEAGKIFMDFVGDLGKIETGPGYGDATGGAAGYALRFALVLHIGKGKTETEEVGADTMRKAIGLAVWGIGCAAKAEDTIAGMVGGHGDGDWDEVTQMAVKIKRKGRVTRRELFRSFNDQRSEVLMPVLEKALERGLVVRGDDGRFAVPEGLGEDR